MAHDVAFIDVQVAWKLKSRLNSSPNQPDFLRVFSSWRVTQVRRPSLGISNSSINSKSVLVCIEFRGKACVYHQANVSEGEHIQL